MELSLFNKALLDLQALKGEADDVTLVQHLLTGCLSEQGATLSCVKMAGHGRGCSRYQINSSPIQEPIINDTICVPPAKSLLHCRS